MTSNILALSPLLLAAACFADLPIFCLGVATDLRFFSRVWLARFWSPASVSAASPAALSWSLVTNTWDSAAVFSSDLRGVAVLGAGLNTGGRAATDLRDNSLVPLLLLMADRGCWLVLAKPGTRNDDLKSITN